MFCLGWRLAVELCTGKRVLRYGAGVSMQLSPTLPPYFPRPRRGGGGAMKTCIFFFGPGTRAAQLQKKTDIALLYIYFFYLILL